jgi:hypothetical protein
VTLWRVLGCSREGWIAEAPQRIIPPDLNRWEVGGDMKAVAAPIGIGLFVVALLAVGVLYLVPPVRAQVSALPVLSDGCHVLGMRAVDSSEVVARYGDYQAAATAYLKVYSTCNGQACFAEARSKLADLSRAFATWRSLALRAEKAGEVDAPLLDRYLDMQAALIASETSVWRLAEDCVSGDTSQFDTCAKGVEKGHQESLAIQERLNQLSAQVTAELAR